MHIVLACHTFADGSAFYIFSTGKSSTDLSDKGFAECMFEHL